MEVFSQIKQAQRLHTHCRRCMNAFTEKVCVNTPSGRDTPRPGGTHLQEPSGSNYGRRRRERGQKWPYLVICLSLSLCLSLCIWYRSARDLWLCVRNSSSCPISRESERRCSDALIFPTHRSVPEWRVISDDSGRLEASTNIPYVLKKVSRQGFYVPFPGHHSAFLRYFSEACSRETLQPPAWDHSCMSFAWETICDSLSCKHTFAFVWLQFVFKVTYN